MNFIALFESLFDTCFKKNILWVPYFTYFYVIGSHAILTPKLSKVHNRDTSSTTIISSFSLIIFSKLFTKFLILIASKDYYLVFFVYILHHGDASMSWKRVVQKIYKCDLNNLSSITTMWFIVLLITLQEEVITHIMNVYMSNTY